MQQPIIRNMRSIYIETHERQYAYKKHETYKKWTGRAGLAHLDFSHQLQILSGWSRLRTLVAVPALAGPD